MSEELLDEIEAINSIFGDSTLVPHPDSPTSPSQPSEFILQLPQDASSLLVWFPPSYPSEPPQALGTHSSSGGVKGAGLRDLQLFQDALRTVFQEGVVCLFDALGEWESLYAEGNVEEDGGEHEGAGGVGEEDKATARVQGGLDHREGEGTRRTTAAEEEESGDEDWEGDEVAGGYQEYEREHEISSRVKGQQPPSLSSLSLSPAPSWTVSDLLIENKSTFVAHVAHVSSPDQARRYLDQLLDSDRRIASATHNVTAWRIKGADGKSSFQDCDDDGEAAAGARLLHLMQVMGVWDAMVVVTRWYGGVKLGPRRFAVMNAVAREGFVRAGMGTGAEEKEKEKEGKGGNKKKKGKGKS